MICSVFVIIYGVLSAMYTLTYPHTTPDWLEWWGFFATVGLILEATIAEVVLLRRDKGGEK